MPYGDRDWTLPDLSFMGDEDDLKRKADAAVRAVRDPTHPASRHDGVEKSGSMQVTVDDRGRVVDVEILDDWNEHLDAEDFGTSLFHAYQAAVRNALNAAAVAALSREHSEPPDHPREQHAVPDFVAVPPTPEAEEQWVAAIDAELHRIEARLARVAELNASPEAPQRAVRSPAGCITARLRGSEVVGIDGDPGRIEVTNHHLLRQDVLAGFRRAQRSD